MEPNDFNTVECAHCGTSVTGDPTKYGEEHAEFTCSYCTHTWLGSVSVD